jgi:phage tail protein X
LPSVRSITLNQNRFNRIGFLDFIVVIEYYTSSAVTAIELPDMTPTTQPSRRRTQAFSRFEALYAIAIIAVMCSLVVAAITNASRDANPIGVRQHQAALNKALQVWGRPPHTPSPLHVQSQLVPVPSKAIS